MLVVSFISNVEGYDSRVVLNTWNFTLLNTFKQEYQKSPEILFGEEGRLKFGLRTQFKYVYTEATKNHDIMIRRTRLKFQGSFFKGTKFKVEVKSDDAGREGHTNRTSVEDISLFLTFLDPNLVVRIGLFDAPFSRDNLTSDSKLLLMDRSDLSEGFHAEGLSDNTFGMEFYGLIGNHLEYHMGIYDNDKWGSSTVQLMPMVRLVGHILDAGEWTNGEYRSTHPKSNKNLLNIGGSIGYLGSITTAGDTYNLTGYEVDVFASFNFGWSFQAEYGKILRRKFQSGQDNLNSRGLFLQTGYRFPFSVGPGALEMAYRIMDYDPDIEIYNPQGRKHSIGLNYYLHGHDLKVQADYTFIDRKNGPNDGIAQIQIQIDF
jgi:hypothetical protein